MNGLNIVVAGGAGFIGSHVTSYLHSLGANLTVLDNCSTGRIDWLPDDVSFIEVDLTDFESCMEAFSEEDELVLHFAADSEVNRSGGRTQFDENTSITQNILEAMRTYDNTRLGFTSSSTVYGQAPRPTHETFGPLEPISVYGASKVADEALCSAYANLYNFEASVFRFANIVGPRLRNAVIPDFIDKLQTNPNRLEILGDGRQEKSYMHVTDCIKAMEVVLEKTNSTYDVFNIGTNTTTTVIEIADIVCEELEVDPKYEFTGGTQGWMGDVTRMQLSSEKLEELGWKPEFESNEAIRRTTQSLINEMV